MPDAGAIEAFFHLPAKIFVVNLVVASTTTSTACAFVKWLKDSYL